MDSHGTRRVTNKVWKGILLMWSEPEIIALLKEGTIDKKSFKQGEKDCVIRAVDWALSMKSRHG
jgi:hypothetical protein